MSNHSDSSLPQSAWQKEDRYRVLVDGIRDFAICMLDARGHVATWNTGAEVMTGYSADEAIGRHVSLLYPAESIARGFPFDDPATTTTAGRFEDEGWRVRKDGSRFWANVVISALPDQGTSFGYALVTRDLTARHQQDERIRHSEEHLRLLVEGVKDYAIFLLTPEGMIASWNAGAEAIKGYKADEIIGQHFSRFYPPEALNRGWPDHELAVALAEGRFEDEFWRLRKDGSRFWANVVITALFDAQGLHRGFAKVTRDLTSRRRIEELEQSARRQEEFLAMLAHELRNPLAPIRTAVNLIDTVRTSDAVLARSRQVLNRQVSHLTRLVDDLLDMSRATQGHITLKMTLVTLNDIAAGAVEASRPLIDARGHELVVDLPAEPLTLMGEVTRLTQDLENNQNNAAKYTPPKGRITLRIYRDNSIAVVRVRDNGAG